MSAKFEYFVTVNFKEQTKPYYFGLDEKTIGYGDYIVVETTRGLELVEVISNPELVENLPGNFDLKPVLRKANAQDIDNYNKSLKLSEKAMAATSRFIKELGLNMNPISAEYTLDHTKILVVYVGE